jgi:uncharacterized membrane protein YhfC
VDLLSITHFLNGILMIAIPISLGIYLTSKFRLGWKIWLVGGAAFVVSQLFHLPFNLTLLNPILANIQQALPGARGAMVVAGLLGLSAGMFETTARYAMYRWWLKDARSWRKGILAGAGHGGVEAIILGSLVLLAFINMMAYRQVDLGSLDLTTSQVEQLQQQTQVYWSLTWYDSMLGVMERIFTIPFHIAASLIVLQVFTRKPGKQQIGWLFLAVFLHASMDASAVFIAGKYGVYTAETVLGVLALIAVLIIFALRQPGADAYLSPSPAQVKAPPAYTPSEVPETLEKLEDSRYQ